MAAFCTVWLGVWLMSLFQTVPRLFDPPVRPGLVVWLVLWTVGGLVAAWTLLRTARPGQPERLILGANRMVYDPGDAPVRVPLDVLRPERTSESDPIAFTRRQLETLRLQPGAGGGRGHGRGRGERLSLDVGGLAIDIAPWAKPHVRRFIHQQILAWRDRTA